MMSVPLMLNIIYNTSFTLYVVAVVVVNIILLITIKNS